jgi:phage terminase small subunit
LEDAVAKKQAIAAPDDLDEVAARKWNELAPGITPTQRHLLANLCRNHSNLLAVRRAKASAVKNGTFEAMVTAKNGALVPSPYIRTETRLLTIENRMLAALRIGDEVFF